jgi:MFS family permease
MFRSLAGRDYRVWFVGALVSNIGAWMQATAQNWVVLTELTANDALAVGITMALQFAPQLLLVPITGLIADRFERRKILMVTQTASCSSDSRSVSSSSSATRSSGISTASRSPSAS